MRWDALTADGIIMMASNQHFERALLQRLVAVQFCKCKPCTAITATLDKLCRCALNGVSSIRLHVLMWGMAVKS